MGWKGRVSQMRGSGRVSNSGALVCCNRGLACPGPSRANQTGAQWRYPRPRLLTPQHPRRFPAGRPHHPGTGPTTCTREGATATLWRPRRATDRCRRPGPSPQEGVASNSSTTGLARLGIGQNDAKFGPAASNAPVAPILVKIRARGIRFRPRFGRHPSGLRSHFFRPRAVPKAAL